MTMIHQLLLCYQGQTACILAGAALLMLTIPVARHVRGSLDKLQRSCCFGNFVNSQNLVHRKSHGVPFNVKEIEKSSKTQERARIGWPVR